MFRTTLLLIALCALGACDATRSSTTSPSQVVTNPPPQPLGIHGILRRVVVDDVPTSWALEVGGGEMYTLVGGPVDTYESLLDKDVFIVGIIQDGTIMVDTCDERPTLITELNRR